MKFMSTKFSLLLVLFIANSYSQSKINGYEPLVDRNSFLDQENIHDDEINDIVYSSYEPEFDEPEHQGKYLLETFSMVIDEDSKESKLEWLKNELLLNRTISGKIPVEVLSLSSSESIDSDLKPIVDLVKKNSSNFIHSHEVPPYEDKIGGRSPDATSGGIKKLFGNNITLSFLRLSANGGVTTLGIILEKGMTFATQGIAVGVTNGTMSFFLQAFNKPFGGWLVSGKSSEWLMNSNNKYAVRYRERLEKKLMKNPKINYQKHGSIKNYLLSRWKGREQFIKWGATEVVYSAIVKTTVIAQSLDAFHGMSTVLDLGFHAGMGMFAQGPLDIAIHTRKYQKLKYMYDILDTPNHPENMRSYLDTKNLSKGDKKRLNAIMDEVYNNGGKLTDDLKVLRRQLGEMLHPEKFASNAPKLKGWAKIQDLLSIGKSSHKYIKAVQTWANTRAVLISMVQVSGLGMSLAGIPAGTPILLGLGSSGMIYYGKVKGWTWKGTYQAILKTAGKPVSKARELVSKVKAFTHKKLYPGRFCVGQFNIL